jgi:hypothetical protein
MHFPRDTVLGGCALRLVHDSGFTGRPVEGAPPLPWHILQPGPWDARLPWEARDTLAKEHDEVSLILAACAGP